MSYYKGDFYQGDFYRGDPGFFSLFGKVARGIGSAAAGLIPGIGGLASKAISKIPIASRPGVGTMVRAGAERVGTMVAKHPVLTAAGAAGTIGLLGGRTAGRMGMVPAGEKGFHISRKTGRVVRNRHMRVTNPKALRRALRRAHGFAKLAMRTIHLVHPRKKARFGGFKKKRVRN
jgi:hypothetical protein